MANKAVISTALAPAAIGPYSQAIKVNGTVYISGQIPLNPETMEIVDGTLAEQARQAFANLAAVAEAAGGSLADCVKVNIFLVDLADFDAVNNVMRDYFEEPYPARACVQVAALPKGSAVEIDAVMVV